MAKNIDEKINEEKIKKKKEEKPKSIDEKSEFDEINEKRWEYDLPPIDEKRYWREQAEYMDETYGYDIGS